GSDWRERAAGEPRLNPAGRIQAALHVHGGDGVKVVEADVVLAGPDYFDGFARRLRKQGGLHDVGGRLLPGHAAAGCGAGGGLGGSTAGGGGGVGASGGSGGARGCD